MAQIKAAGHEEILQGVFDTFFARKIPRIHCVWMHGRTACGKSSFIERFEEIFVTQKIDFIGARVFNDEDELQKPKVQVATSHEFNVDALFQSSNLPSILQLFEGKGAVLQSQLFGELGHRHEGTFFLLASNRLPDWGATSSDGTPLHPILYET